MKLFSYDDICLKPKFSTLQTRDDADTSVTLCGQTFKLPVIPASMEDVISWDLASGLSLNNYFYIMHRFNGANSNIPSNVIEFTKTFSLSVGVKDEDKLMLEKLERTPDFVSVDVAHAHHKNVADMLTYLHKQYVSTKPRPKFIVGNVATEEGYRFLCDYGADVVKVGIGSGAICTTRFQTGFYIPVAYSVWKCAQLGLDVPIIADGGAKQYGDIAKALVLGATFVMNGSWFASCVDSPAKIVNGKKLYRGSTSYEAKKQRRHIEGKTLELDGGLLYCDRLDEIQQALRSSISYAGGRNLDAFNSVEWELI